MSRSEEIISFVIKKYNEQKISKKEFAETIGCTVRTLNYWLRGERGISVDMADAVLRRLGITYTIGKDTEKRLHHGQEENRQTLRAAGESRERAG